MATPAPLFDPKTFSYEQLAALNNTPGQSLFATNTLEQLKAAGGNIPVEKIGPAAPIGVKNPNPSAMSDLTVIGAEATAKSYEDYLKLLQGGEKTDTELEAEKLRSEVSKQLPETAGRGAAQLEAERKTGVSSLRGELSDLNSLILSKTAEYNKLLAGIEGKPITMESIIGEQAQVRKAQAADIGLLQALALGKQGQLAAAQSAADRAVDLKYDDIEQNINIRLEQLKLLQPTLNAEEKQRSDALQLYLDDQRSILNEQKDQAKQFQKDKLNAVTEGMPVSVAQQVDALYDAGKVDEAYSIMGRYTAEKSTGPTDDEKLVREFNKALSEWDLEGTREQFIRRLQARYPEIDPNSVSDYVYHYYPDGYND